MVHRAPRLLLVVACLALASAGPRSAEPIQYRFTFPEPQHHWMQVEATFPDLPDQPLELRMSRSSPGRYSLHEFAKNVYDVRVFGRDGRELTTTRPDPDGWSATGHGGLATVRYRIFGDLIDGTYLAIDTTHAHINMPAAILWVRGLDDRPSTLSFTAPAGAAWQVATQLHRSSDGGSFTAPNLRYLMDSPVEFGPLSIRQFSVGAYRFRFAAHHQGTDSEVDDFVKDVQKVVRQETAIFGELPQFEPGDYTFLADYLPYATSDGMEHRNSTVMTDAGSLRTSRRSLLDTVAHEFFHTWNVERIRPRSLEPFDFERANVSSELWLAEGFTQYYGPIALQRAGLADLRTTAESFSEFVEADSVAPGRAVRSADDMSRMAPFVDGASTVDRTNWTTTYVSYYSMGGAIALALDLTLRQRSDGAISLDDFMRAMWRMHGKPGGTHEGDVDRPYTAADIEARLAEVSGDAAFARDFLNRYVHGRESPDYRQLLARGGFAVRKRTPGRAWWGDVRLELRGGRLIVAGLVPFNSPLYAAGIEQDDEIRTIDAVRMRSADDVSSALQRAKPRDVWQVAYVDRAGAETRTQLTLGEDPHIEVLPIESAGGTLTAPQRAFRERWLGSR
jgi:predicted metalloprotease with PDZ domain